MKNLLRLAFVLVLAVMTWVTVQASLDRSVFKGFVDIWADPWGRATLADAYFAFFTVFLWIAYREASRWRAALWFVLLLTLGNFAIAGYFLWALQRLDHDAPWTDLFKPAARKARIGLP